jgi:hypothetical protein
MATRKSRLMNQTNKFSILGKQDCHADTQKSCKSGLGCGPSRKNISRDFGQIFFLRFPHLSEAIFNNLDNQSLVSCRGVGRTWMNCLDTQKFLLMRKIQKSVETHFRFNKTWQMLAKNVSIGIIQQFDVATVEFFSKIEEESKGYGLFLLDSDSDSDSDLDSDSDSDSDSKPEENYLTPIHVAAFTGNTFLWKALAERVKETQPCDQFGRKPLHYAAAGGQLEICQSIMEKNEDEVPRDIYNDTPLHFGALNGNLEVCKAILEQMNDKNPKGCRGYTPLHYAASSGHLLVCK